MGKQQKFVKFTFTSAAEASGDGCDLISGGGNWEAHLLKRLTLPLHLATRGRTRFITDCGSLVQPSAEHYQHSPTATVRATERPST